MLLKRLLVPILGIPILCLLLMGCDHDREMLIGQWQAVSITEAGDSMRLNTDEVGFLFQENGVYQYFSTLGYQEAGRYRYERKYLFAKDTTQPNTEERIVAIDHLTPDSMVMRMQQDSLERIMVFLRK